MEGLAARVQRNLRVDGPKAGSPSASALMFGMPTSSRRCSHIEAKNSNNGIRFEARCLPTVNVANYVEQNQFDRSQVCSALRFVGPYCQRSKQRGEGSRQIKDVIALG